MTASPTSRVKRYVFDLDGTLFDTEALIRRAYISAGVIMPYDAWGKPAREWLPEVAGDRWASVHMRKNEIYLRLLKESPPERSTAARAMIDLSTRGCETFVLTGASRPATAQLLTGFQPYHFKLLGVGCSLPEKLHRVRVIGYPHEMVYVDNDDVACDAMAEIGCHVVRYKLNMMKEEVLQQWEASSSLPAVASD